MHDLDQLLTTTGAVPDISPAGVQKGSAELDTALRTGLRAPAAEVDQKAVDWRSGRRVKTLIGTGIAVAGSAAAAIAFAIPSSSAGSFAKPAGSASGTPARGSSSSTTLTAAVVLDQAAQAAGAQASWPNAQYWYTEDKYVCGGQLYTDKTWLSRHGSGLVEKSGPKNGGSCSADLFTTAIPAGIANTTFGPYTWSQLFALPTQPATLERKLMTDSKNVIYEHPANSAQWESQQESFEFVMMDLLCGTPAQPALREALFKVAASIPGVKVTGSHTDALGRTGTALQLGAVTIVLDPASGVVLDESDSGTIMFVAQGPAAYEPKVSGTSTGQGDAN